MHYILVMCFLCKQKMAYDVRISDWSSDVCSSDLQGGPLMHVIAAKAVAFHEALQPDFLRYCQEVIDNAMVLGDTLSAGGLRLVTGGTDCHLLLADLRPFNVAGNVAVEALERCGLTANKNAIP